ncbi:FAD-dependent oxidoreductase, partial [Spongiibacter marinus]|uniref:FAD-dependent oxidoreductase n=1 Tax=Spongiibacter marinus TaxID=354246 RepID=UPI003C33CFB1
LLEETVEEAVPHHEEEDTDHNKAPVVIVGTGLAGYGLAKEFRKHDKDTPLIIVTSDDGRAYSKPMLSTGYTKNTEADDLAQMDAGTAARTYKASVWTMTQVTAIDTENQTVRLGDGNTDIHYKKLVLAVGADVIRPPLEGDALEYVYSVNDLLDYDDFRTAVRKNEVKKVCLIGGGL